MGRLAPLLVLLLRGPAAVQIAHEPGSLPVGVAGRCRSVCQTSNLSWDKACLFSDCHGCEVCAELKILQELGVSTPRGPAEPEAIPESAEGAAAASASAAPVTGAAGAEPAGQTEATPEHGSEDWSPDLERELEPRGEAAPADPSAGAQGAEPAGQAGASPVAPEHGRESWSPDLERELEPRGEAAPAAGAAGEKQTSQEETSSASPEQESGHEPQAAGVKAEPRSGVVTAPDVLSTGAAATAVAPTTEAPQSKGAQPADVTDAAPQRPSRPPKSTRANMAKAVGDPHLVNVYGQKFDILLPGLHTLIQVPQWAALRRTLLTVSGDAQQMGGACADMYFQNLNITGNWVPRKSGLHFYAEHTDEAHAAKWMHLGQVRLKVVWGHTAGGIKYLNLLVKNLGKVKLPVGGLLGEDDHAAVSKPPRECRKLISL